MTENQMADTPFEGQNPFEEEEGDGTSTDSPTENNEEDENGDSGADDKNQKDPHKDVPFHDHPRWKQREEEWQNRFNTQEKRHQDDIKSVRDEFATARKDNRENDQIPAWFGGYLGSKMKSKAKEWARETPDIESLPNKKRPARPDLRKFKKS